MKRYQYTIKQTTIRHLTASNVEEALDTAADVYGADHDYEVIDENEIIEEGKERHEANA